jgi:predicted acetyltransferase/2-polyprenyl-3-methyl-5-hydroxy-6-metoxy-1,4-benzoquinol methylase
MDETTKIVRDFYDESHEFEYTRIANRPEFLLTCRMLDRYIKRGDKVLDIGGGPGRYSLYLAEKGCDVTLFDLSPKNTEYATERAVEQGLTIKTVTGDARNADKLLNERFDHVLLMGPLYHLLEEPDRVTAVNAALKLLKPGGLLFAAFISMSGGLVYLLREMPEMILEPSEERFLIPLVEGKSYGGAAFTQAYFVNQNEVLPFIERFPLQKLHLFGQEGFLAPNEHKLLEQPPEVIAAWLDLAEKMFEKEEYLSWAEHLMYVGRKDEDDEIIRKEIAYYNAMPCEFDGFIEVPELYDGVIRLICTGKREAIPEKKWVPAYDFAICRGGEQVGEINLRIGYTDGLYYGGQIGYGVDEKYRGNGYAVCACQLLAPVAKAHGMTKLLITNRHTNDASRRVCEKLGAKLIRTVRTPEWHDLYKEGHRFSNIFEWSVE